MAELEKPIIFIGVPRAGTTIISEIIFQHEDLAWPSNYQDKYPNIVLINKLRPLLDNKLWRLKGQKKQLNIVSKFNKYAFKPAEAYSFWKKITPPKISFSRDFLIGVQASEKEKNDIRNTFKELVKNQQRKRLAFKITGPGRISFLHSIFPDAIFIEITREPYANIRSLLKVPFWESRGKYKLWWNGAYTDEELTLAKKWENNPALLTALQYKKIRETTRNEIKISNAFYIKIAYEDFVKNPNRIINEILIKTGLQTSVNIDDYLKNNKIYNRNINSKKFFKQEELVKIKELFKVDSNTYFI